MPPPPLSTHDGLFNNYPELDTSCRLLGPTALIVQALLGILVIVSLVYKRHRESPRRPWKIWIFDVGKQLAGQMFVHTMNLLISGVVAEISSGNACVFYFLNILIDTTLGIAIIYFLLKFFTVLLTEKYEFQGFISGQYGSPPSLLYWLRQTAVYVLCLTMMKLFVIGLFIIWPGIFQIGEWCLGWLGNGVNSQLVFVMGIFPIIMNVLQFWLIDSIVKGHGLVSSVTPVLDPVSSRDRESLFRASVSDDEDDRTATQSKIDIQNLDSWVHPRDEESGLLAENPALETKSSSSSTIPLEVERDDVVLHRYKTSLQKSHPSTSQPAPSIIPDGLASGEDSVGSDEWAWDEPEIEEWETKDESNEALVDKQDLVAELKANADK